MVNQRTKVHCHWCPAHLQSHAPGSALQECPDLVPAVWRADERIKKQFSSNFNTLITSLCETHQTLAMSNELKQIQTARIV